MYSMEHLFTLITAEKARELRLRADNPPIMVLEEEQHPLQGPPISGEDVLQLLRSVANSRQMRELRESGAVRFVYTLPNRSPFVVQARMDGQNVAFAVS